MDDTCETTIRGDFGDERERERRELTRSRAEKQQRDIIFAWQ